jgi:hypothetical protein
MRTAEWTDKLEYHLGHLAIPHITRIIVIITAVVYVLDGISAGFANAISLEPLAIMHGEIWRLFTFLFITNHDNAFFIFIYLMFTWWIGESLEHEWGAFKLNLYIALSMMGLILSAFFIVGGQVSPFYFHASLVMAFGTVFPKEEFFIFPLPIPIQARFLVWLELIIMLITLFSSPLLILVIIPCMINYISFFGPPWISDRILIEKARRRRKDFK